MQGNSHSLSRDQLVAYLAVFSIVAVIVTRALVFTIALDSTPLLLVMTAVSSLTWVCLWLWFKEYAPIVAMLAMASYLAGRMVRFGETVSTWNDANSFYHQTQKWSLTQWLVILAFALLSVAMAKSGRVSPVLLWVVGLYCAVSTARVVLAGYTHLGEYTALTFARNLFGGASYIGLGVFFLIEIFRRREA
ncbi:hypothetical protein [Corynebacterium sp. H130]|uniref:hypothetical protein n=1 Tax=Corynebacterium sp. H130 TaxID=3133444 RepID=UPI0030A00B99